MIWKFHEDIIIDRDLSETEYKNDDRLTQYSLCFNCEVVDFRLNKKDQAYYDAMKAAEE